jgi:transcriptional regulator with XRE-family HTH domain
LRERRIVSGISQQKLAAALGLTFQQVYKYEQGKSRISAGRLYEFAKVLEMLITFFFEGTADALAPAVPLSFSAITPRSWAVVKRSNCSRRTVPYLIRSCVAVYENLQGLSHRSPTVLLQSHP